MIFLSSEFALSGMQTVQHREKKEKKSHQRAVTLAKVHKKLHSKIKVRRLREMFIRIMVDYIDVHALKFAQCSVKITFLKFIFC